MHYIKPYFYVSLGGKDLERNFKYKRKNLNPPWGQVSGTLAPWVGLSNCTMK